MISKISIMILAYNSELWIQRLFDGIYNQIYNNFEVLVLNDGSKDNTLKIIKDNKERFEKKFGNDSFKYFSQENKGVGYSFDFLLKHISGDFFTWIDSDDEVSPLFLKKLYYFAKKTNCDVAVSNILNIDENDIQSIKFDSTYFDELNDVKDLFEFMLFSGKNALFCSPLIRTSSYKQINPSMSIGITRVSYDGQICSQCNLCLNVKRLNEPLLIIHSRSNSVSHATNYLDQKIVEEYLNAKIASINYLNIDKSIKNRSINLLRESTCINQYLLASASNNKEIAKLYYKNVKSFIKNENELVQRYNIKRRVKKATFYLAMPTFLKKIWKKRHKRN